MGNVAPEALNPLPVTVSAFMTTAAVPVEVKVSDCVSDVPTPMFPKARLELLTLKVGTDAPSCSAKVWAVLFALAVSVAVCAELTEETVAVKLAALAPAGTITAAGTVTALLLLARLTAMPPESAPEFSVIVQMSVPAPVIEPLAQVRPLNTVTPVPLRLTVEVVPAEELLLMVNVPATAPGAAGANCTVNVAA